MRCGLFADMFADQADRANVSDTDDLNHTFISSRDHVEHHKVLRKIPTLPSGPSGVASMISWFVLFS